MNTEKTKPVFGFVFLLRIDKQNLISIGKENDEQFDFGYEST